eukprot:TRINITY_DN34183_c0_g1_i1.p1 TRINITY_DN34183_c0_g1~~TRINITY_DN34183_c0_g1_i1.p1  ORF type:complete len:296 (+),score=26.14 TRINITY_DN34183_c0_g1_i1:71-958(+)
MKSMANPASCDALDVCKRLTKVFDEVLSPTRDSISCAQLAGAIAKLGDTVTYSQIESVFRQVDPHHGGCVPYVDLVAYLCNAPACSNGDFVCTQISKHRSDGREDDHCFPNDDSQHCSSHGHGHSDSCDHARQVRGHDCDDKHAPRHPCGHSDQVSSHEDSQNDVSCLTCDHGHEVGAHEHGHSRSHSHTHQIGDDGHGHGHSGGGFGHCHHHSATQDDGQVTREVKQKSAELSALAAKVSVLTSGRLAVPEHVGANVARALSEAVSLVQAAADTLTRDNAIARQTSDELSMQRP